MIEAGPRPPRETDRWRHGPGWGGDGWDDGSGGGWGWSGDDNDGELPYRRSRVARAVALVTAAAVVVGSIGSWVAVVAVNDTRPALVVGSLQPRPVGLAGAVGVEFSVTNTTARTTRASCRAVVQYAGEPPGSAAVTTPAIRAGGSTRVTAVVGVAGVGSSIPSIQAACVPARSAA